MSWERLRRMATVLLALFASVGAGWAIAELVLLILGDKVQLIEDGYEIGTFLALGGMVLLFIKDVLSAVLAAWSYIWNDDYSRPSPREISVWAIEATVAAAILFVVFGATKKDCPSDWNACVIEANDLSRACFLECMRDREVTYLTKHIMDAKIEVLQDHRLTALRNIASAPLLFYNARTDVGGGLSKASHGVSLQPGHADQLRRIAEVFKENCPQPQNATLRVVGSSSEAPFRDEIKETSKALNVRAAHLRAKNVAPKLDGALNEVGLNGVRVELGLVLGGGKEVSRPPDAPQQDFDEMRRSAFPGVDYLALADPQHQARSVFVEVVNPSACFEDPNP